MTGHSYTGRTRSRQTPKSVRTAERVARALISAGGVGTIIAVTAIFAFLLWVVIPLFFGASMEERTRSSAAGRGDLLAAGLDEYRHIGWTLDRSGRIAMFRADDGTPLGERRFFDEAAAPTAWCFPATENELAFGYRDGTIRTGRIRFETALLEGDAVPADLRALAKRGIARLGDGIAEGLGEGRLNVRTLVAELDAPVVAAQAAIELIDLSHAPAGRVYATLSADARLTVHSETVRENMLTGEMTRRLESCDLPYAARPGRDRPQHMLLSGIGNLVYLVWRDGVLERYDVANPARDAGRSSETSA